MSSGQGGAAGHEGLAGAAGAGGDAPIDPICGAGMVVVGQFATWCGLVNTHTLPGGGWAPDSDCSSGCNVNDVEYCKKFWPEAVSEVAVPPSETKAFPQAGCGMSYSGAGQNQYACCAPL